PAATHGICDRRRIIALLLLAAVGLATPLASTADAAVGDITEFTGPIDPDRASIADIAQGPNGNLWFTEGGVDRIGRIDPRSGEIREFDAGCSLPLAIVLGADSNLWYTCAGDGKVGRMTPAGVASAFPIGGGSTGLGELVSGPDGDLWVVDRSASRILRVSTAGALRGTVAASFPEGIASGVDGAIWVAEGYDSVRRITTAGASTVFTVPTGTATQPTAIETGPQGRLWVGSGYLAGVIWRLSVDGSTVAESPTGGGYAAAFARGPLGNMWFTDRNQGRVVRSSTTGVMTAFSSGIPAGAELGGIAQGPDGNMWFVSRFGKSHVLRVLTGAVPVSTVAPDISGTATVGATLRATTGAWTYQPTGFAYRWERCTSAAGGCAAVAGRTGATYQVTATDAGRFLRVGVTASNLNGSSSRAYSAAVADGDSAGGSSGSDASGGTAAGGGAGTEPVQLGSETIIGVRATRTVIITQIRVSGAGHLRQIGHVGARVACRASKAVEAAGVVEIRCGLTPAARALNIRRALRVALTTTFTPNGSPAVAETIAVRIPRAPTRPEPVVG
ncbi:MAG: hypothetical protein ACKOSO_08435, partial [Actinomycetota bacterium]